MHRVMKQLQQKKGWVGLVTGILLTAMILMGCQRGDMSISPVVEGQIAPHAGWNLGPDIWVDVNDPVRLTGVVIRVKGLDPDDIFE